MTDSTHNSTPRRRRVTAALLATLIAIPATFIGGAVFAPAAGADVPQVLDRGSNLVTSVPLPTAQINGIVWDQTIIGNTVYAVGDFSSARPPGAPAGVNEIPKSNILAYDIRTGQLINSFAASLNSQAKVVIPSADGTKIYVGGEFTQANGANRYRLAAFDAQTGALDTSFFPILDYRVSALSISGSTIYVGGKFGKAGPGLSASRQNLAAFSTTDGGLLDWAPTADAEVLALVRTPDQSRLVAGGRFQNVNGQANYGMGALNPASGASMSWPANNIVRNAGNSAAIVSLNADDKAIYGTGYHFGAGGNIEGTFSVDSTGSVNWVQDCHGDTHDAAPLNGYVYTVSHAHYCSNVGGFSQSSLWRDHMRHSLAFTDDARGTVREDPWGYTNWEGTPAPALNNWFPDWGVGAVAGQAGWTVEGSGNYVVIGGEFTSVNNIAQQGLVRFGTPAVSPGSDRPRLVGSGFQLSATSQAAGTVRVSFPANWDRDDNLLSYSIYRGNTVVHQRDVRSTFWDRPIIGFTDTGLAAGSNQSYRVRVQDGDGNVVWTDSTNVTVASSGAPSPYADAVMADGARLHWRLGESPGAPIAADALGFENAVVGSAVDLGTSGAIVGDPSTAGTFSNSTSSYVTQQGDCALTGSGSGCRVAGQQTFSVEAWFKTTSNSGGRILGFGNSQTGTSSKRDRQLYLTNDGRVKFGVALNGIKTTQSPSGQNNGQWHHVVGTVDENGMKLFLDGNQVDSNSNAQGGEGNYGYWRVGRDSLSGWPDRPTNDGLIGQIDEAAVYWSVLTPTQVQSHHALGTGGTAPVPPTASFTTSLNNLALSVDGSASTDPDGSVVAWNWNFGDGATATGQTASHTYAAAGTYTVTLTVTDNSGATAQTTRTVTASSNVAPTASFTTALSNLALSVDGSASTDPDGSVVAWNWNFGDGATATGQTASHTYAAAGTYTVTLTVTDNAGATAQTTRTVTANGNDTPIARAVVTPSGLSVSADGSTSSDPDGSVVAWNWNFGDGATATGQTASHTYAAAGTYTVTLTVTDNAGATATATVAVTVSQPGTPVVNAADSFNRTVTNGWGNAGVGGPWNVLGFVGRYGVNGNVGTQLLDVPGRTTETSLSNLSATDMTGSVDISFDKALTGGGAFSYVTLRDTGDTQYRVRIRARSDGTDLNLFRVVNNTWTALDGTSVPGLTFGPGVTARLAFDVTGTSPTTLKAKIWNLAGAEPANPQVTATDNAAQLQGPGGLRLTNYLSGSATNSPVTVSYDNLLSATGAVGNIAPIARAVVTPSGLSVSADGSTSSDPDGSVVAWNWNFGDGATATGQTASHTYAAAGTYTVTLTVTDNAGATATATVAVTVSQPGTPVVNAADSFNRTVTNGWGNAGVGGPWNVLGFVGRYGVNGNVGTQLLDVPGRTTETSLSNLSATDMTGSVDISFDKALTGGGAFSYVTLRDTGDTQYRVRIRARSDGTDLNLFRVVNNTWTALDGTSVPGLTFGPGVTARLAFDVTGTSPTTLKAKIWNLAGAEPANPQVTATDNAAQLQGPGGLRLTNYLSGSATNSPVTVSYDNLLSAAQG